MANTILLEILSRYTSRDGDEFYVPVLMQAPESETLTNKAIINLFGDYIGLEKINAKMDELQVLKNGYAKESHFRDKLNQDLNEINEKLEVLSKRRDYKKNSSFPVAGVSQEIMLNEKLKEETSKRIERLNKDINSIGRKFNKLIKEISKEDEMLRKLNCPHLEDFTGSRFTAIDRLNHPTGPVEFISFLENRGWSRVNLSRPVNSIENKSLASVRFNILGKSYY